MGKLSFLLLHFTKDIKGHLFFFSPLSFPSSSFPLPTFISFPFPFSFTFSFLPIFLFSFLDYAQQPQIYEDINRIVYILNIFQIKKKKTNAIWYKLKRQTYYIVMRCLFFFLLRKQRFSLNFFCLSSIFCWMP